ncbi:uroporphyrinogen-III synthase [Citreimonas salinaria]|uniref:Uroporphyrinogen-III synthase n=1 Tax=Citreimonas salinaria TaxID=321339 RepID=A0A1H3F9C7_9RHOB|nr:uroporphyrinogen-III synthase [Citreimonas salinaria]SDX87643.1 uroporphyrinogen-III synthase [Citreimonas salinaria]
MPAPPTLLLLTRPESASRAFLEALRQDGIGPVTPILSPLIDVRVTGPLPDLRDVSGLIFTSANGVRAYAELGGSPGLTAFTVGSATARAAEQAGLRARSAGGDADSLVAMLGRGEAAVPLVHLRGSHARGDVACRLTEMGVPTTEAVIYDQPLCPPTDEARAVLQGTRPVVVPLFSPRTATAFAGLPRKAPIFVAAFSEAVAMAAGGGHIVKPGIARQPQQAAMIACTAAMVTQARELEARRGRV